MFNFNCNIDSLKDLFYKLALEGSGSQARGKYFFALHLYNFILDKELEEKPSKESNKDPLEKRNKANWLKLVFDVVNDYQNGYIISNKCEETIKNKIQEELEQSWQNFIIKIKSIGLNHIAHITDEGIKFYLKQRSYKRDRLSLYLGSENLEKLDINAMRVLDVFCWLPSLTNNKEENNTSLLTEGHSTGSTLVKKVRGILDDLWYQAIENLPQQDNPRFVNFFGCLPPSSKTTLEIITDYLEKWHEIIPKGYSPNIEGKNAYKEWLTYSFDIFYMFATNSTILSKLSSASKSKGRYWQTNICYSSEQDREILPELFDDGSLRDFELIRLGLSDVFPKSVLLLDKWLESCEDFPELQGGEPWWHSIEEHIDEIENVEDLIGESVINLSRRTNDGKIN